MAKQEFVRVSACSAEEDLDLRFQKDGLGPHQTITVYGLATVVAEWESRNPAGQNGQASAKAIIQAQVAASGAFTCDDAGQVTGHLRLSPPRPTPQELKAGGGEELLLLRVIYRDIQLLDETNWVAADLPGVFEIPTIAFGQTDLPGNAVTPAPAMPPDRWSSPRYP